MKLTRSEAIKLLNESKGMAENDNWIKHSICVGDTAAKIAEEIGLDKEKAMVLGYIHDIGKRNGYGIEIAPHDMDGYEYIKGLGYDEEYANICLTHSYLNNDINCIAGGIPNVNGYKYDFRKQFIENHEYTIYEKLINLSDLMCTTETLTLEKRLIDLITRKGVHENTIYHIKEAQKLKAEIDGMLGHNIYELFSDILYN